jgi:undecaprenyl phosphate-alpha-L-ara4N flippase subunit ArnE
MFGYYAALIASVLLGVIGQLMLKNGAEHTATVAAQFQHPSTLIGLGIYALAALLYIAAIKAIPVSVAFPSVSVSYVLVAIGAHILWNEPFGFPQVVALLLIVSGVFVLHQ